MAQLSGQSVRLHQIAEAKQREYTIWKQRKDDEERQRRETEARRKREEDEARKQREREQEGRFNNYYNFLNDRLVSKETAVQHQWGSETPKNLISNKLVI